MKPYFIEIKDSETRESIVVDMEGPYHDEGKRIGEHIYGVTIYVDGVPYHFEKYVPTDEEISRFVKENEGKPEFSESKFLYRIVPFAKWLDLYNFPTV